MNQEWELMDNALKRNVSELEATTMNMRMTDLSSLFKRMEKVVRSYVSSSHKKIIFETEGEDIELDKKVIDMLGEPMIHLVRNAMDHGIESPEERIKAKKLETGTIRLKAKSQSGKVVISIEDDGKGIDGEKILKSAINKGLDCSHINGPDEAVQLIFAAGFSTAEEVTDVSGRGVGMDAVKQSIEQLGGDVKISTAVGKGSTFNVSLPLSMSVVSSIIFKVNGNSYGASINSLIEVCRESENVLNENNNITLFPYRGEFLNCYDLRSVFSGEIKNDEKLTVCILDFEGEKAAFRVDNVFKHTEIVVKETKGYFPKIDYINGVSILATGEPIFVISMGKIYRDISQGVLSATESNI